MQFSEGKAYHFDLDFTEIDSQGSNWPEVTIGSDNGLELNRGPFY